MQSDIFGWRRCLLRSFVQLAIKNQALREWISQRHVLFEAHRSLNTKIPRYGFFFFFFISPDVGRIEIFSAPLLSRRGRGTWSPVGRGGDGQPVLLQTVKIPHPSCPPDCPANKHTFYWPTADPELTRVYLWKWDPLPALIEAALGRSAADGRRNVARAPPHAFPRLVPSEHRNNQACAVLCRASCQQPPTGSGAVKQTFAQGPLSSVFVPSCLSIHFSLCCTLFAPAASRLCETAASIRVFWAPAPMAASVG